MSTTEVVTGSLKGMGYAVECRLMVTRNDLLPRTGPAYVRCGMLEAPACLPDGYYEAAFFGHTAFLHRADGCWNVGVPWRARPASQTAAPVRAVNIPYSGAGLLEDV